MTSKVTRREAIVVAAAMGAGAIFPSDMEPRPSFVALSEVVSDAVAAFRQARIASRLARPRILEEVRRRGIISFFDAPEIRARSRARHAAQTAVENICMRTAANDREALLQEAALAMYENELGGSPGLRERFPPSRRILA